MGPLPMSGTRACHRPLVNLIPSRPEPTSSLTLDWDFSHNHTALSSPLSPWPCVSPAAATTSLRLCDTALYAPPHPTPPQPPARCFWVGLAGQLPTARSWLNSDLVQTANGPKWAAWGPQGLTTCVPVNWAELLAEADTGTSAGQSPMSPLCLPCQGAVSCLSCLPVIPQRPLSPPLHNYPLSYPLSLPL